MEAVSSGAGQEAPENIMAESIRAQLESDGVTLLVGTAVDFAGGTHCKGVPIRRLPAFRQAGMGASPSWNVFCADNGIAFTSSIGPIGDLRLRLDTARVRKIDDGLAWGPATFHEQDGSLSPLCPRGRLAGVVDSLAARGLSPLMGTELEFVLTTRDGGHLPKPGWTAYGMGAVVERRAFLVDLTATLEAAGLGPEQIHAEYGEDQFEVSLAPAPPVEMADGCVLARILIGIVAARHNMAVSFSPLPWADGAGNGAHLHLSLKRDDTHLFSGGEGPHGITAEGGSAIAGILAGLDDFLGVYAASVLSAHRLRPGRWSGAAACWGLENREAAVRFVAATAGNPHGANVELKVVDPSANIYLAAAALLGSVLHGIEAGLPLPVEVPGNPADAGDWPATAIDPDQATVLNALEASQLAGRILGPDIVEGVVAVRRHEAGRFAGTDPVETAQALRFAWSA
ncbi:glutamine synthetase family protein [Arthrobacter silvisoli]|uniref:glutamine synthetase family protein n=1 Tax=Arthrobacter silvisoli TaxID=2291022 RepID=UPI001B34D1E3|nr:glutamine synthetase family protein [Arthrobacter silvisoli]